MESELCQLRVLEVLKVVIRCMLLCILETVEGELCFWRSWRYWWCRWLRRYALCYSIYWEALESELCQLHMLEVMKAVMRCISFLVKLQPNWGGFRLNCSRFRPAVFLRLYKSRRAASVQTWRYSSLELH